MLIKFWSKCRCAGGQVQRVRHRMPAHMVPWRRAWIVEQRTDDSLYVSSFPLLTLCARQFIIVKIKVHHVAGGILKPCRSAIRQTIFYFVFPYGRAGIGRKGGRGCTYLNNSCPRQETPSAAAADNCFGLLLPAEAYITLDENKGQARPPSLDPFLASLLSCEMVSSAVQNHKTRHGTKHGHRHADRRQETLIDSLTD